MNKACCCATEALALSALQKCSTVTSLREARQLHALVVTTTTTTLLSSKSPFLYNNIISMYARCGSLTDSHVLFDKMPHKTLVSYNALLSAYSRAPGHAVSALKLYTQMGFMAVRPSSKTFTSLLQASSLLEDWWFGSLLHAQGIKFGFLSNICVQTSLLNMYSNCGDLGSAEMVFGNMGDRDDVAWNSLIIGYLKNNKIKEGLRLFSAMLRDGFVPTQFTYSMILSACSRLKGYQYGILIHGHLIVRNVSCDLHMQNALLDMYCNAGNTQTADKMFCGMENPDLVSWNSMIAGYSENEDGKKAMSLFVRLQEFCFPKPDDYTYAGIISATGAFPCSSYGKPLHAQVIKAGLERSVFVGSTLVSMYFKNCEIEAAQGVFNSVSRKDVVLWTEIIIGYSKTDGMSAIKCFSEMFHKAQGIDDYVLSAVLSACADLAVLRQGEMIHCYAVKLGYGVEMSVSGSLIDMYAKNGCLEDAYCVFSHVSDPDLKCWNSMLGGYSLHGMVEEAFKLFEEILEQGLIPDQVTFLSLLSACSHCRLVEQGRFLWNYMNSIALVPGPKHYSCMVSLLSRAALLEEAEEIIIKSPYVEDNLELWRTLLSASVINKNLKVGVHAAEEVLRLDANDGPTLVLLSNLYASAGQWDKVAETRRNMKGLLVEKSTGLSWIEAKNNIHAFSSGDQSHPMADEVQAELYRLKINMVGTEIDEHEAQNAYAT
ncbi:pentatricopeptide repeat-containing protein At3g50420 [Arachis stenosperma]|uniref:pentatricopeptide repeat-containing protein At3g50420 n=1 Tax=Arachis stenosperma TaxID=217475 RepID=UPI0025ACBD18|nr:pentatricopeptide repeat-containing protein At3g50420 [Arachis stenosperma]